MFEIIILCFGALEISTEVTTVLILLKNPIANSEFSAAVIVQV